MHQQENNSVKEKKKFVKKPVVFLPNIKTRYEDELKRVVESAEMAGLPTYKIEELKSKIRRKYEALNKTRQLENSKQKLLAQGKRDSASSAKKKLDKKKILIGAMILDRYKGEDFEKIMKQMDLYLTRDAEREVFGFQVATLGMSVEQEGVN